MANEVVKMTVRLPARLHAALRRRAAKAKRSVNVEIISTLREGLSADDVRTQSEQDAVAAVLRESGLWAPSPRLNDPLEDRQARDADHSALRRVIGNLPPLSEVIVDERQSD